MEEEVTHVCACVGYTPDILNAPNEASMPKHMCQRCFYAVCLTPTAEAPAEEAPADSE